MGPKHGSNTALCSVARALEYMDEPWDSGCVGFAIYIPT